MAFPSIAGVEFRAIDGYPGYCVGDDGSVWSCKARGHHGALSDEWLKRVPGVSQRGYLDVVLCRHGKTRHIRVSRLVLEAFVGPCPVGMEAAHENGNNSDNRRENLRWDTHKNNIADKLRHGTSQVGERSGTCKFTDAQIAEMRAQYAAGATQKNLRDIHGIGPSHISRIVNGQSRLPEQQEHTHIGAEP